MWSHVDQGHYFTSYYLGKQFKWGATSHKIYLGFLIEFLEKGAPFIEV